MSNPAAEPLHLEDSDLLALVDDEFTPMERDVRLVHVARCGDCAQRLQALRLRTANFSRLLSDVQLPDDFVYPRLPEPALATPITAARSARRSGWTHSAWARAAVIALVVIIPFATVAPLRAWVMDRLGAAWSQAFGGADDAPAPAVPAAPSTAPAAEEPAGGSTVFFTPAPGRFVLEVAAAQASGTLTLGRAQGSEGSAEVIGGAAETPLVSESGIRILNTAASTASYRVLLPPSVPRVRLRVGGGPAIDVTADELARGRVVELAAP